RAAEQAVLDMEHVAHRVVATRVAPAPPVTAATRPAGEGAAAFASAAAIAAAPATGAPAVAGPRVGVPLRFTSSFVGRDDDCARVTALLARAPVVTLVGPGGVGKTRLAFEVAAALVARGSTGCHVVELARLQDPSSVPAAVAAGLGLAVTGAT